jgi:hypothetical protein
MYGWNSSRRAPFVNRTNHHSTTCTFATKLNGQPELLRINPNPMQMVILTVPPLLTRFYMCERQINMLTIVERVIIHFMPLMLTVTLSRTAKITAVRPHKAGSQPATLLRPSLSTVPKLNNAVDHGKVAVTLEHRRFTVLGMNTTREKKTCLVFIY